MPDAKQEQPGLNADELFAYIGELYFSVKKLTQEIARLTAENEALKKSNADKK